ncbi:glycerol-3-phosphate dehydrogenase/oxidase [Allorhizobium terrae]|uniref:Glycerol-3-phosphate dehydrogenase/oxidase n=1 Tax=Allorhizobium terrae TaxID=1848972 RepID=A0A4S3ZUH6_9HYPH|nr:glycerol-3-phosphate dehydrogenase/oxidase [Allorhizobium terrae]THF49294.1 glycerol-3-phosphate dehydrogenase/oxidase [Allorhizobium terrae]
MNDRNESLFDVVILGAGINGAGLFRDLCEQGIKCLLVEKTDFGAGTSAAPSRLIHGGLKYLETGEFSLVAQSTLERNLLLKNAPHCVTPLPTFIPAFSWMRGIYAALRTLAGSTTAPRSRGALLIKVGLALYDFYGARHRVMPRHRFLSKAASRQHIPPLTDSIVAGGIYYDAKISRPERLVYELVRDGLNANSQSRAVTYTDLVASEAGVLSFRQQDNTTFSVKPSLVVNASGPWIDRVNAALGTPTKMIGGTKGSHILLDHPELLQSLKGHMIYFEADDGRICLVYDYLGFALVGSTDIPSDNPDAVRCEEPELDYFLDSLRSLLPGLSFDREQVVYSYSGIRPLPASDAKNPGLISRDHSAPVLEANGERPFAIISLVGGKWTTFRGFAEEVTDSVLARLDRKRVCSTQNLPIGGGRDFPASDDACAQWVADLAKQYGLSTARAAELLSRYGTTARAMLSTPSPYGDDQRLSAAASYSALEIDWLVKHELVVSLADIVFRRTSMAIENALSGQTLQEIAAIAAPTLGWDAARQTEEIEAVIQQLRDRHGVNLRPPMAAAR